MKIAVISNHYLGIEFAKYVNQLEADVVFYWTSNSSMPELNSQENLSIRFEKLLWVQKRSISENEFLGQQRMKDLFRIVFEKKNLISVDTISQIKDITLQTELKQSLEQPTDSFDDVDAVITIYEGQSVPHYAHPSGAPALGELRLNSKNSWHYVEGSRAEYNLPDEGEVALIEGQHEVKKILTWLTMGQKLKKARRVFWITTQADPWSEIKDQEVLNLKEQLAKDYQKEVNKFLKDKNEWEQLDSFIKVKTEKPQEPIPQLVIFAGHHLSSVDQLMGNNKIFLTLEYVPFRKVAVQSENALQEIKTISVDSVFVFQGSQLMLPWGFFGQKKEIGYLEYNVKHCDLMDVKSDFEFKILPFFSREN